MAPVCFSCWLALLRLAITWPRQGTSLPFQLFSHLSDPNPKAHSGASAASLCPQPSYAVSGNGLDLVRGHLQTGRVHEPPQKHRTPSEVHRRCGRFSVPAQREDIKAMCTVPREPSGSLCSLASFICTPLAEDSLRQGSQLVARAVALKGCRWSTVFKRAQSACRGAWEGGGGAEASAICFTTSAGSPRPLPLHSPDDSPTGARCLVWGLWVCIGQTLWGGSASRILISPRERLRHAEGPALGHQEPSPGHQDHQRRSHHVLLV